MLVDILLVTLVLLLVASLPAWPYSRKWGYYGTGGIGVLLLVVAGLVLLNVF